MDLSRILYEDNHLLIFNKYPSEIVQGDKTGDPPLSDLIKAYLKEKYQKPGEVFLGVVHRIDRPVSGAVIFARTSKALNRMNALIRERKLIKLYWAVVSNPPPSDRGTLENWLLRNEKQNKTYVYLCEVMNSKLARLDYKLLASSDHHFLLEVNLITGRHHQVRAQLSHAGCPIRGDLKYGYERSNPGGFIHLHARYLAFQHPVKKELICITAPTPPDRLWEYFEKIHS